MNEEFSNDALNGDHSLQKQFVDYIDRFSILTIVETGTYQAKSTLWFAQKCKTVITIESQERYFHSVGDLHNPNIHQYLGQSQNVIYEKWNEIKSYSEPNYLFWLDAHWLPPCPTPFELLAITRLALNPKPVIVIHDFKVPGKNEYGWDLYDDFQYNWVSIRDLIDGIYGTDGYEIEYNREPINQCNLRGCIFVSPK